MARGAQKQAKQNFDNSQDTFGQGKAISTRAGDNASHLYDTLTPQLEAEASDPQGYGAEDLGAMNTAAQQSNGGAVSAVKGEAGLEANRTGNRGSLAAATAETVRNAMRTNSEEALNIQGENAKLKQAQQQAGIAGLEHEQDAQDAQEMGGLNSEDSSIGAGNQSVNAELAAGQSGWYQNFLGFVNAAANAGKAASGLGVHV